MRKGQTATEYLIILGVVIVIALIVVGVMGGLPNLYYRGQEPSDKEIIGQCICEDLDYNFETIQTWDHELTCKEKEKPVYLYGDLIYLDNMNWTLANETLQDCINKLGEK